LAGFFCDWQPSILTSATLPGWRRSADRACLHVNSLLTGNFTGKLQFGGHQEANWWQEIIVLL
jgi:hypothetical protein